MHFYPGVAEYQESGKDAYRVFLNEDTIRSMDPTFAGKPIFVEHVDEVTENLDQLRKEADGWVVESFFNSADGKHWAKFVIVSERGKRAIKNSMRLSNAYIPKSFSQGGLWNGVTYSKEITSGEYEHLAIVKNPRYEESVILTPEEFKKYNEAKEVELKRLANSQDNKGESQMKLNIFKKTKAENDMEGLIISLPKSKKEMTLEQIVNAMDEMEEKKKDMNSGLADMDHKVKMHDGSYMNVGELMEKHKAMCDELESMKSKKEDEMEKESDVETKKEGVESESVKAENEDEGMKLKEEKDKAVEDAKKKNAKEKADKLRNAGPGKQQEQVARVEFAQDQVARGKERY